MSLRSTLPFLLIFCFAISIGNAQSTLFPYQTKSGTESILLGTGLLMAGTTIYLGKRITPLTLDQINNLSIDQIPTYDRYSTRYYSHKAHQFSNITGLASIAFPVILFWKERNQGHKGKLFLIGLEGALITAGITNITKMLVRRPRPFVYNDSVPYEVKMKLKSQFSFFSGHTSMSAYFAFSSAQMYSDLYPNSNKKAFVWGTAAALPLLTAFGRMRAGKHFPTDVAVGYAVGAVLGILIPRLHRKIN